MSLPVDRMDELTQEIEASEAGILISIQKGHAICTAFKSREAAADVTLEYTATAAFEAMAALLLQEYGLQTVLEVLKEVVEMYKDDLDPAKPVH